MNVHLIEFFQEIKRIKEGVYMINFDNKESKGAYWVSLFIEKSLIHSQNI